MKFRKRETTFSWLERLVSLIRGALLFPTADAREKRLRESRLPPSASPKMGEPLWLEQASSSRRKDFDNGGWGGGEGI